MPIKRIYRTSGITLKPRFRLKSSFPIRASIVVSEQLYQGNARLRAVKNKTFSRCTSSCTKVFTLWVRTPLKEHAMPEMKPQKQRN